MNTLDNPSSVAVIARLIDTANRLAEEGARGNDPLTDTWVSIVQIGRLSPERPAPGVYGALLRAGARVANKSASLLESGIAESYLRAGELQSLDNASAFAKAARALFWGLSQSRLSGPLTFTPLLQGVDAVSWAELFKWVYADITLTRREFLRDLKPLWGESVVEMPIRMDSAAFLACDTLSLDPLLYSSSWDLPALATRLASGIEVAL